jgi:3-deoxy-manno-octulosonate cytidylyltransferase (CMP-KDO synthetase)
MAIIPARYGSQRLPGKPLIQIHGKSLIQRVCERVRQAKAIDHFCVATDDIRIYNHVKKLGYDVIMTRYDHPSGTFRCAEVLSQFPMVTHVVNIQGDEPLIDPAMIDLAIQPFLEESALQMGTVKTRIKCLHDFLSPNVVKVVTDNRGDALYFSRSPLPFFRDKWKDLKDESFCSGKLLCYKHVGLYVYRRNFLLEFAAMPATFLEISEKLEQLRAIENGVKIRVVETEFESIGVDTPDDLLKAQEQYRKLLK